MTSIPTITVYKKEEFRRWLKKHHQRESKVAVVVYKRHTGKPAPSHRELMEEAICYGWIDTTIKRLDDKRFIRHFSKRSKHSRWSNNTVKYAKQLIAAGRMKPHGFEFFKMGLAKPTHDYGLPTNPRIPGDLKAALARVMAAEANFKKLPPSAKRTIYRWILRAKQASTRQSRIKRIVVQSARGKVSLF